MTDHAADAPDWYRDAIIYSCHVRSFQDSDGDGFGDFRGLTDRLDYLQDLGVTAIWLLPFYPSPLRDDGYDIADYTSIHPDYGTMRQVKRFVKAAHERGLKVITELVINHTSDEHPWFKRAVAAPKGSRYRDWYVWSDTPEPYPEVRIIFQDFETSNWSWHPEAEQYYWHRFFSHQPDLNFDNPEVQAAITGVLDFWAEIGVDGFRLDAIPYLFEREGTNGENLPETHAYLKELRRHLDERWPDRMFLAEANQWPEDAAAYFGDGDECHMNFHFPLMPRLFMSVRQEDRFPVVDILQQTPPIPDGTQWALFLRNHDELTLEMVTDEERDFMYRAYAHDAQMRINLGIRRRLSPLLGGDRRLIELMNSLLFSLPGTPVLYYGDEIGMGDNIWLGDRNGVRTPMQWAADRNAGFSSANPQRLYLPVVIDPEYHYERINVESQEENASSLLWWMKRLIALRQRHTEVFGRGELDFVYPDNHKVFAFVRRWRPERGVDEQRILVVANLSRHAQAAQLPLEEHAGLSPVEMFGRTAFPTITDQPYSLTLGPYQFYWFSLERAPSRLSLSQMREGSGTPATPDPTEQAPELTVAGEWRALLRGPGRERFEAALPDILRQQRWFGGKARQVNAARLTDVAAVGPKEDPALHLAVVSVDYVDGEPEDYVLAFAFAEGEDAGRLTATAPRAVLAHVKGRGQRGQTGVVYDPLQDDGEAGGVPAAALLETVARGRRYRSGAGEVVGRRHAALGTVAERAELRPKALRGEQSNSSVVFGDRYLMKVLRRLEPGESPDVEIGRELAGRLDHVPELVGTLDRVVRGGREPSTLAILQRFVPNEGDAWIHTLDELERYAERMLTDPPLGGVPDLRPRPLELAADPLPEHAHELVGPYLDAAHLLGVRTAQLHLALATGGGPDMAPEPFTSLYQRSLYQSMRNALRRGLQVAKNATKTVEDTDLRSRIEALVTREDEVLDRLRTLSTTRIETLRTRTHGDYHLGQVLWTGRDLVIIDFEGEPARPLGERRLKRSPLRDVAGMLRSFQYASHSALRFQVERGAVTPERDAHDELRAWLAAWNRWVSAAFLRGYLTTAGDHDIVPRERRHTDILLDAFQLEKALYELAYEMNNRPEWVDIPLSGIAEVLGDPPA